MFGENEKSFTIDTFDLCRCLTKSTDDKKLQFGCSISPGGSEYPTRQLFPIPLTGSIVRDLGPRFPALPRDGFALTGRSPRTDFCCSCVVEVEFSYRFTSSTTASLYSTPLFLSLLSSPPLFSSLNLFYSVDHCYAVDLNSSLD